MPDLDQTALIEMTSEVDAAYPRAYALYVDLHEHPELSGYETRTAGKLATELRSLGYTVTEHVGPEQHLPVATIEGPQAEPFP